jgi:hypothetical protein
VTDPRIEQAIDNLTDAAEKNAATALTLAEMAAEQMAKINREDPMESQEDLQAMSALLKISSEAAALSFQMIAAASRQGQPGGDLKARY